MLSLLVLAQVLILVNQSPLNIIPIPTIPLKTTPFVEHVQPNLLQTKITIQSETEREILNKPIPKPQKLPQPEQEIPSQHSPEPQPNIVHSQSDIETQNKFE